MAKYDYPTVVVGAGPGGLVVANGLAKAGKKVLLIDRGTWGGDCTNFGCVPSKSLIASSHIAHALKQANRWGIHPESTEFTAEEALARARSIASSIRTHEEPEALAEIGVDTLTGTATFVDPHTLEVEGKRVTGKNIVLAVGSRAAIPPVEGLEEVPYLTNENVFEQKDIPRRLLVVGGGPIGSELGLAFHRFGAEVSIVVSHEHLLMREDPDAGCVLTDLFQKEGIQLHFNAHLKQIEKQGEELHAELDDGTKVTTDRLLIAIGRTPNTDTLNLKAAGVTYEKQGIPTDKYGRTNQKHIWALGDITPDAPFTHVAENRARAILTSLLLPGPLKKKIDWTQPPPRCTYTDPEVAHVGLLESEAIKKYGKKGIATYKLDFTEVDRAICAGKTEGFIKVVTKKWSSRILGATIVGARAGEMLPELSLALAHKIPLRKLASLIHPYPSYAIGVRQTADQWLTKTLLPALRGK